MKIIFEDGDEARRFYMQFVNGGFKCVGALQHCPDLAKVLEASVDSLEAHYFVWLREDLRGKPAEKPPARDLEFYLDKEKTVVMQLGAEKFPFKSALEARTVAASLLYKVHEMEGRQGQDVIDHCKRVVEMPLKKNKTKAAQEPLIRET